MLLDTLSSFFSLFSFPLLPSPLQETEGGREIVEKVPLEGEKKKLHHAKESEGRERLPARLTETGTMCGAQAFMAAFPETAAFTATS